MSYAPPRFRPRSIAATPAVSHPATNVREVPRGGRAEGPTEAQGQVGREQVQKPSVKALPAVPSSRRVAAVRTRVTRRREEPEPEMDAPSKFDLGSRGQEPRAAVPVRRHCRPLFAHPVPGLLGLDEPSEVGRFDRLHGTS